MADRKLEYVIGARYTGGPATNAAAVNFTRLRQTSTATTQAMTAGSNAASKAVSGMSAASRSVVNSLARLAPAARASLGAVQSAATAAHGALSRVAGVAGTVLQGSLVASGVGAAALAGGLALLAKRGVEMNVTFDGARTTLTRMSGSAANAERLLGDLRKEAVYSSLTFAEMLPVAQGLVAVLGPGKLGAVVPIMRAFGDAATALRVDSGGLDRALYGFRQLVSQPFARQEELNQINESLPGANVGGILRQNFGTADTQTLEKAGVTGMMVGEAIVRGLSQSFGGSQRALGKTIPLLLSGITDSVNDLAAGLTVSLTGSVGKALQGVLGMLSGDVGQGLQRTLTTVFSAFGRVLEAATAKLPEFVGWLEKIATSEGVTLFLINSVALLQTLAEQFGKFFGFDIKALLDPSNVTKWFDTFGVGVKAVIDGAFGLGRVWKEVGVILKNSFTDTRDYLQDWTDDAGRMFKGLFFGLQASISGLTASMLSSVETVLESYNRIAEQLNRSWIFRRLMGGAALPTVDTTDLRMSGIRATADAAIAKNNAGQQDIGQRRADQARGMREQRKDQADPYRYYSPTERIEAAFTGRGRDISDQESFWQRLEQNRLNIARSFFQGSQNRPVPRMSTGGPQLYGQPAMQFPGGGTVRNVRSGPTVPGGGPASGGGASNGDPYRQVRLADGSMTTAAVAEARGAQFSEVGGGGRVGLPNIGGGSSGSGGSVQINLPLMLVGQPNLQDPNVRAQIHAAVDERLDQLERRSNPSLSGF